MNMEQEQKAIEQTIQYFFDGIDRLDPALVQQAFDSPATQFLSVKAPTEPANTSDLGHFLETMAAIKSDPTSIFNQEKCEKTILYIDVTGSAAGAKVRLKFSTFAYTDYYHLLKVNGEWKIVNKTFDTQVF